jgi:hypothetical protein
MNTTEWEGKLAKLVGEVANGSDVLRVFADANSKAIQGTIDGYGPDDPSPDPNAGARAVFNIPSLHVPPFIKASLKGEKKPYKNGYDLGKYQIGEHPAGTTLKLRELVDGALPLPQGKEPKDTYFAAGELNGTGIRFYGDICLVLKRDKLPPKTVILDRNSYDLIRSPLRQEIETLEQRADGSGGFWNTCQG